MLLVSCSVGAGAHSFGVKSCSMKCFLSGPAPDILMPNCVHWTSPRYTHAKLCPLDQPQMYSCQTVNTGPVPDILMANCVHWTSPRCTHAKLCPLDQPQIYSWQTVSTGPAPDILMANCEHWTSPRYIGPTPNILALNLSFLSYR
jgi:hypothetical protein